MATKKKHRKVASVSKVVAVVAKRPTPGGYMHKPIRSIITLCLCGNKYIVTRSLQRTCLDCVREMALAR